MQRTTEIVDIILAHYSHAQAIYVFGSHGTADERPGSDVDIGLLLGFDESKAAGSIALSDCAFALENALRKPVDLIQPTGSTRGAS